MVFFEFFLCNMKKNINFAEVAAFRHFAGCIIIIEILSKKEEATMTTVYYKIADHLIEVTMEEEQARAMSNYQPFLCEKDGEAVLSLTVDKGDCQPKAFSEEWRQEEEGSEIVCGLSGGLPTFIFRWNGKTGGYVVCNKEYSEGRLTLSGYSEKATIDNTLMVMYAMATADKHTLLFHSSTVSHNGKAYMFLGVSGTGKSTHSKLWLKHIAGTILINDDNPVVREKDGKTFVYGSPWSGKTPCYKQVRYELGGIVDLSQAPYNKIRRMKGIEAYLAVSASVSGKRWEKRLADGLHESLNTLAMNSEIWHLDCLPDEEAARICCETVSTGEESC